MKAAATDEEKYIKLLEERVDEIQQQLANEQKRTTPPIADEELLYKYLAYQLQFNSSSHVPNQWRFTDAKCTTKAESYIRNLNLVARGTVAIDDKYMDFIVDAVKKYK